VQLLSATLGHEREIFDLKPQVGEFRENLTEASFGKKL
jgi:hypothetical protein